MRAFLLYDDDPDVRIALLDQNRVEENVIAVLVNDPVPAVRAAVATHPQVSLMQLALLTRDDAQSVSDAAELELLGRGTDAATQVAVLSETIQRQQIQGEWT